MGEYYDEYTMMNTLNFKFQCPSPLPLQKCHITPSLGNTALSGRKYLNTVKYTCTNCVIYRLYNELYSKMRIDIYKYQKYVVLALTSMKFFQFLVFHEVLIYLYINEIVIYWAPDINKWIINIRILTLYLESTSMNQHIFQFSKHSHVF